MKIALVNCTIPLNGQFMQGSIIINGGMIEKILPTNNVPQDIPQTDLKNKYVIPGMVDLQINGGGQSFFTHDISDDCLKKIYESHLNHGTTWWLPTLISTTYPDIMKAIEVVGKCMKENKYGILGMHLEGPFMNPEKKGAHNPNIIRKPTDDELSKIIEAGKGIIKMITIAPEMFTEKQLQMVVDSGICVSAGHSNATCEEAKSFFSKGVKCVTHLFNAMSQFNSRNPGLVGATLDSDEQYAGIIVDGIHCDFASVRMAHKLIKGRLFLVSDASFIDIPVKEFKFDAIKIQYKDGHYYTPDGNLAGSSITMQVGLKNCVNHVNIPLPEAINMATLYPAELMRMSDKIGRVKEGYSSELVILNKDLEVEGIVTKGTLKQLTRTAEAY